MAKSRAAHTQQFGNGRNENAKLNSQLEKTSFSKGKAGTPSPDIVLLILLCHYHPDI